MTLANPQGEAALFAIAADPARCAAGFEDLLAAIAPPPATVAELRARYAEPHRFYHNAAHVGLLWLRHLGHGGDRGDLSLARAILFHDAARRTARAAPPRSPAAARWRPADPRSPRHTAPDPRR
ncbi:MAG TPA: hypothetical protein VD970_06460, partial [Acetobacteraceae bacterium]|nr:hypothetical protein [Acetobacteraceae bacterium]